MLALGAGDKVIRGSASWDSRAFPWSVETAVDSAACGRPATSLLPPFSASRSGVFGSRSQLPFNLTLHGDSNPVGAENREIQVPLVAGKSRDLLQLAAVLALAERITRRALGDIAGIVDPNQRACGRRAGRGKR